MLVSRLQMEKKKNHKDIRRLVNYQRVSDCHHAHVSL